MKKIRLILSAFFLAFAIGNAEEAGWNKIHQISMEIGSSSVNYYATTSENGGFWISNCPSSTPIRYIWLQNSLFAAKEVYATMLTAKSSGAKMKFKGTCQGEYLLVTTNEFMQ